MIWTLLLAPLAFGGDLDTQLLEAHGTVDWTAARIALVDGDLDEATLTEATADDDWRVSLTASAVLSWRADADAAAAIWAAPTLESRAGTPVFDARVAVDHPAVLAERLVHADEPTEVRRAAVEQLRRTQGPWDVWVAGLATSDDDAQVRAICAEVMRYAEGEHVEAALRTALSDDNPDVRAAAARGAGWSKSGPQLIDALVTATQDGDHVVAGFAARSLGWLGASSAFDAVATVVDGPEWRSRLDALRALERIDAERATTHPVVLRARSDADERVARAASQIAGS